MKAAKEGETAKEEESKGQQEEKPVERSAYQGSRLTSTEEFDLFWALKRFMEIEQDSERAR
jgi:hypothetical protein